MTKYSDEEVYECIKNLGGVKVPYEAIYEGLNAESDNEKLRIRRSIRHQCSDKETYNFKKADIYIIEKNPEDGTRRIVTIK